MDDTTATLTYSVSSPSPPYQEYPEDLQTGQHRHHLGAAFCNSALVKCMWTKIFKCVAISIYMTLVKTHSILLVINTGCVNTYSDESHGENMFV